jgi:hypothetical protein
MPWLYFSTETPITLSGMPVTLQPDACAGRLEQETDKGW